MFHMSSILLSLTVVQFILASVLLALWTVRSQARGLREMAMGAAVGAVGTLTGGAGMATANFHLGAVSSISFVIGVVMAARAMASLQGRPPRRAVEAATLVFGTAAITYSALVMHSLPWMLVSISAAYVTLAGMTARDLLSEHDPALKSGCRILGVLFALFALLHLVRIFVRPFIEGAPGPGGQIVMFDVFYAFAGLAMVVGWCLGLLWTTYNSAEIRLRAAYEELDRFSGMVAHDLKSPLTALIGNIEGAVLAGPDADPARLGRFLTNAHEAALRMNLFINDLLAYARTGEPAQVVEAVDLNACLQAARANLQPLIHAVGADMDIAPLPRVRATPLQVTRVFQNLLDNALKYRAHDRPLRIEVTALRQGDRVRIQFRDNGVGIAKADQARVFQRFERAGKTSLVQGDGVGLSECRRILECYGGSIDVESDLGDGATFIIVLAAA